MRVTLMSATVLFGILLYASCTKTGARHPEKPPEEILNISKATNSDNIIPLEIAQKAWITSYAFNRSNQTAVVSSLDSSLDKGIFTLIYNRADSAYFSFATRNHAPVYLKMLKTHDRDRVTIRYGSTICDLDAPQFDSVSKPVRHAATYAALMYFDVLDFLGGNTKRVKYDCNCNRVYHMTAVGLGGTASHARQRAESSMASWTGFWGCSNVQVSGIDTSCWPLDNHGLCFTTIEYTANCPWYAIPIGLS